MIEKQRVNPRRPLLGVDCLTEASPYAKTCMSFNLDA
jgi:hypothetical protein